MTHASHLRAALELRPIAHGLAVGIAVASLRVADLGERLAVPVPAAQRNLRRDRSRQSVRITRAALGGLRDEGATT